MTDDFVNATTDDYGANKIARSPFARAVYFNPIHIAEGAPNAPRILPGALESPAAGDVRCIPLQIGVSETPETSYRSDTQSIVGTPGRHYSFVSIVSGVVRIKLQHRGQAFADDSIVRVLRNGTQLQEWTTPDGTSFVSRSLDVSIEPSDIIEIQHKSSASDTDAEIRNLEVCADRFLIIGI